MELQVSRLLLRRILSDKKGEKDFRNVNGRSCESKFNEIQKVLEIRKLLRIYYQILFLMDYIRFLGHISCSSLLL